MMFIGKIKISSILSQIMFIYLFLKFYFKNEHFFFLFEIVFLITFYMGEFIYNCPKKIKKEQITIIAITKFFIKSFKFYFHNKVYSKVFIKERLIFILLYLFILIINSFIFIKYNGEYPWFLAMIISFPVAMLIKRIDDNKVKI